MGRGSGRSEAQRPWPLRPGTGPAGRRSVGRSVLFSGRRCYSCERYHIAVCVCFLLFYLCLPKCTTREDIKKEDPVFRGERTPQVALEESSKSLECPGFLKALQLLVTSASLLVSALLLGTMFASRNNK